LSEIKKELHHYNAEKPEKNPDEADEMMVAVVEVRCQPVIVQKFA
jgi:hypothetical protein